MRRAVPLFPLLLILLAACTTSRAEPPPVPPGPDTVHPTGAWPNGTVAWLELEAPLPGPATPSPRPAARPCTAADLPDHAELTGHNGAAGTSLYFVELRNAGSSRCSLDGYPLLTAGGDTVETRTDPGTLTGSWEERPATIDPGEAARFVLGSTFACGSSEDVTYRELAVTVAGRKLPIPGLSMQSPCPIGITGLNRLTPDPGFSPRYADLKVSVEAPDRVAPGADLDYVVTLTNPGLDQVPLVECPVYQEQLGKLVRSYLLNCIPGVIPGEGSVRFAVRLHLPAGTQAGKQQLTWTLWESSGPSTSGGTTIQVG